MYDLIIIGAGAAGMSAAIYAGRAKLNTLVIERDSPGGQIRITNDIENYPGIPKISGAELSQAMRAQAESFGATFVTDVVKAVDFSGDIKRLTTANGSYEALAVIVATGATPRSVGFKGEEEYLGRGIAVCATCDGEFFTGMDLFVIGGGLAAAEEALFLTRFAKKVTLIVRKDKLAVPRKVAERVFAHPAVEVRFNTRIIEAGGDGMLRYAVFHDDKTNETWRYDASPPTNSFGIFVFAGYVPRSDIYAQTLELDSSGYILTDDRMRTNVTGVFAAGDVRPKQLRQLVTAVSDGAIASTAAELYVEELRIKQGLPLTGEEAETDAGAVAASGEESAATAGEKLAAAETTETCPLDDAEKKPAATETCPLGENDTDRASASAPAAMSFFDDDLIKQLMPILDKLENTVGIVAVLDHSQTLDTEVSGFLSEFAQLTDKVKTTVLAKDNNPGYERELGVLITPALVLTDRFAKPLGVQFHGVPAGHELNSFVLALYNAGGPGQTIDEATAARIAAIDTPTTVKVGVSLSCTLCPDVVAATQLIAIKNPHVTAEMIDVAHFVDFKNTWGIMSVPAVVVDDERVAFGKRSLEGLLDLLEA
ncbi:MAG: FAD-dependent oxidoreductase [Coriobacteriales bacterium]|jgi:thioredoxin reductase (NADPH)|nr:FAD-dependent oxidoreductase [Coriobacteriales bacterium]